MMKTDETLRHDLVGMVEELRAALNEIGDQGAPQTNVVSNARDRLRYISALTEQAAGQTLNAAEAVGDRLRAQKVLAAALAGKSRSPEIRAFLLGLVAEHEMSGGNLSEIIQAQAFQDLVGQVINKLMLVIQHMEDNLVHLLVEEAPDPGLLAGPAVTPASAVSQDEVDDLFG
ncbi:MAG: protein phosphatase CheZ [Pseudomonadota bacterium]|nr:protein phosphatase CheZ [Pseudomonadota bacterium]MDP1905935.1 protein phosphatase CheZ [Pseudomonadota bacterium]MDP2353818.1 protein phosphatase CheZ [Pseudomonadota bacterium]